LTVALLLVTLGLLAAGVAAGWLWLERAPCVKRTVIVQLKADHETGYRGVLWAQRGGWLTLKHVTAHKAEIPPVEVLGDAVFHRDAILFMQVLPGTER
jgi:hypothetical protein